MKKAFIRVLSALTALALAATPLAAASDVPEKQGAIIVSTIYSADTAEETSGCFTAYSVSELPEDLADYYYDEFFEENLLAVYRCVYPEVVSVEKIHFGLESVSFEDGVVSIETYRNYYLEPVDTNSATLLQKQTE